MGGGSGQVKRAMEKLWDFNCTALTAGREVTCMAWSTARAPSKASITQVCRQEAAGRFRGMCGATSLKRLALA